MSTTAVKLAAAAAALTVLAACNTAGDPTPRAAAPDPSETPGVGHSEDGGAGPAKLGPLRKDEKRLTLTMPETYTPSAPTGVGTDDYRCFLLDPELAEDSYLTGTNVLPGNPEVVHHVILFRIRPDQVAEAEATDAESEDLGWTCFGGTGLAGDFGNVDDAPWLGAWAPGGRETIVRDGYGVELDKGARIVMQVHYNLLAGAAPDLSSTQIRVQPRSADLTELHTYLMPAPVELPCRPDRDDSPLCDRTAAVADLKARVGQGEGSTADALHWLCGSPAEPSSTTSCVRHVREPMTILAAAGHMHLLGEKIKIEINPGTPQARTILDIAVWDFDDQSASPVDPIRLEPLDTVKVTCQHSQRLRDLLPAFEGQVEKYVVWGEGTTDEMCLGILSVALG